MLKLIPPNLPDELSKLSQIPEQLFVEGDDLAKLLARPKLAIVGTRKLTPYGRGVTATISQKLAERGVVIISGLALGADSVAHQACIDAGGQTIAVLASGLTNIYPASHANLASEIIKTGGALISENVADYKPFPYDFLGRNRIIAALSDGVLVTEAAARSGSLNTASHALNIGLPVFAIPGNITSPLSEGCNNLIKAGAIPVTSIDDVLNALNWEDLDQVPKKLIKFSPDEQVIVDLIASGISDGAELLTKSNLDASVFNQALTMLEITAQVRPLGANQWSL